MPLGAFRLNSLSRYIAAAGTGYSRPLTVTANGSAQVDTAQSKFGGASLLPSGSNLSVEMDLPQGDFTIEGWYRLTSRSAPSGLWEIQNGSHRIAAYGGEVAGGLKVIGLYIYDTDGTLLYVDKTASNTFPDTTWKHVAIVNNANTFKIYIDGTEQLSASVPGFTMPTTNTLYVGGALTSARYFRGNVDDFRMSNTARYTSNFTAPTEALVNDADTLLLLHMDGTDGSTTFVDDNARTTISAFGNAQIDTAQSKFGGASALFDGTGDYLATGVNSDFVLSSSSDWTIELWVKFSYSGSGQYIITNRGSNGDGMFQIETRLNNVLRFYADIGATTINLDTPTSTFVNGTWYHLALVKNGGTVVFYVDGVNKAENSWGTASLNANSSQLFIGAPNFGSNYFNGWIDEVRFSNTARYTTGFTPESTAFTNDANTLLLLHMDGTDGSTTFTDDNG